MFLIHGKLYTVRPARPIEVFFLSCDIYFSSAFSTLPALDTLQFSCLRREQQTAEGIMWTGRPAGWPFVHCSLTLYFAWRDISIYFSGGDLMKLGINTSITWLGIAEKVCIFQGHMSRSNRITVFLLVPVLLVLPYYMVNKDEYISQYWQWRH